MKRPHLTFGDRAADLVAYHVGRWRFIIVQTAVIAYWIWANATAGVSFDPYPFILLNLLLSLQSAYTGPVLLISQNRADSSRQHLLELVERHTTATNAAIGEMRKDHTRILAALAALAQDPPI